MRYESDDIFLENFSLYEPVKKITYLNQISNQKTRQTVAFIFNKAYQLENLFKKDISEFDEEQYYTFLKTVTSDNSINSWSSYLKKYKEFTNPQNEINIIGVAKKHGLLKKTHDLRILDNSFASRLDFYSTIKESLYNYRDRLMFSLIYEGLEIEEILALMQTDYKDNRLLIGDRYILMVDNLLAEILDGAINEPYYTVSNGVYSPKNKARFRQYRDNNIYLLKFAKVEKNRDLITVSQLFNRNKVHLNRPKMTAINLKKSAVINYAYIDIAYGQNEDVALLKAFTRYRIDFSNPLDKSDYLFHYKKAMITFKSTHQIAYDKVRFQSICTLVTPTDNIPYSTELPLDEKVPDTQNEFDLHASVNTESGLLGEKVVFKLLSNKLKSKFLVKRANENNDYAGYDISIFDGIVEIEKIEVKTMISYSNHFYISRHELETAEAFPNNYYIYVLIYTKIEDLHNEDLQFLRNSTKLIKIKNPIVSLGIDMDFVRKQTYKPGVSYMRCKEFEIYKIDFNGFETVEV